MIKKSIQAALAVAVFTVAVAGCTTMDKNKPPPPAPKPMAAKPMAPPPAPAPMPAAAPAPAPKPIVITNIMFDNDKATLTSEAKAILDQAAGALREQPGVMYEVSGHTDDRGSLTYNQSLSVRRANATRDYLVSRGVPGKQLITRGFGETQPSATNSTSQGRARNRRAEIWPAK